MIMISYCESVTNFVWSLGCQSKDIRKFTNTFQALRYVKDTSVLRHYHCPPQ